MGYNKGVCIFSEVSNKRGLPGVDSGFPPMNYNRQDAALHPPKTKNRFIENTSFYSADLQCNANSKAAETEFIAY